MSGVAGWAGPDQERPATDRAVIQISRPLHTWLSQVKEDQQRQLGRQVTFTEIIEQLRDRAGAA